jgi:hypothetical protein
MLLCHGVGPRRANRLHCEPRFCQFAMFGAVALHAGAATRLARRRIGPFESETKPGTIALERVIVHYDPDVRSLLVNFLDFIQIGIARNGPAARFIVPDVVFRDALGHEVISALVPDPFPSIEQIAHHKILRHKTAPFPLPVAFGYPPVTATKLTLMLLTTLVQEIVRRTASLCPLHRSLSAASMIDRVYRSSHVHHG